MMRKALFLALTLHFALAAGLIWSSDLDQLLFNDRKKKMEEAGTIQVDLLYKATYTKMRKGEQKKDLPPPKVKIAKPKEAQMQMVKKKKKPAPSKKKEKAKEPSPDLKSIVDSLRSDIDEEEERAPPKEDNFPTVADGQEGAFGTGGRSQRQLSPAEQALQTAMRKHFELAQAEVFRDRFPNARGFLDLQVIGVGNRLQIVSLSTTISSGFSILDRSCELAVRKALQSEVFSDEVITELTGKESTITCEP